MKVELMLTLLVDGKKHQQTKRKVSSRLGIVFEDTTLETALEKAEEILNVAAPEESAHDKPIKETEDAD